MLRILLVDDEVALTRLLKRSLEDCGGCIVEIANSGAAGLAAIAEFKPDIVVLDIIMPDMRGTDVLAAMRADPRLANTPVMFLTAVPPQDPRLPPDQRSLVDGCRYLVKPVTAVQALAEVRKVLTP